MPHMTSKSSISTDHELLPLATLGEILWEQFLKPLGLSANTFA